MKDLKVEIPVAFKERLERRFSYENRTPGKLYGEDYFFIYARCPFCKDFRMCNYCPFTAWARRVGQYMEVWLEGSRLKHCWAMSWIVIALEGEVPLFELSSEYVAWPVEDDERAKDQLARLRRVGEENIEWI